MKKIKAAAEITQVSVDKIGGEEQGAPARATPEGDGTGTAARRSEKVRQPHTIHRHGCLQYSRLRNRLQTDQPHITHVTWLPAEGPSQGYKRLQTTNKRPIIWRSCVQWLVASGGMHLVAGSVTVETPLLITSDV